MSFDESKVIGIFKQAGLFCVAVCSNVVEDCSIAEVGMSHEVVREEQATGDWADAVVKGVEDVGSIGGSWYGFGYDLVEKSQRWVLPS